MHLLICADVEFVSARFSGGSMLQFIRGCYYIDWIDHCKYHNNSFWHFLYCKNLPKYIQILRGKQECIA